MSKADKKYLGDGVHAELQACGIIKLTNENVKSDPIYLEPKTIKKLQKFIKDCGVYKKL